jgi:hypothetical protein
MVGDYDTHHHHHHRHQTQHNMGLPSSGIQMAERSSERSARTGHQSSMNAAVCDFVVDVVVVIADESSTDVLSVF